MKRVTFLPTALAVALALAFVPAAWAATTYKYKILHTFTGDKDGGLVASNLLPDKRGNLYGATYWGGTGTGCGDYGCGVAFRLAAQNGGRPSETVLFNFDGWYKTGMPDGDLALDGSSDLYGNTSLGTIFELSPGNGHWNFNAIYFDGGGCLVFDQAGNLYGCIGQGTYGGGAVGELSPGSNGWAYTDLYDFCPPPKFCGGSGDEPKSPLSWDAHSNLYGTTLYGGNGYGVAFQLAHNGDGTWTYHVLHRFLAFKTDGAYPYAGLTLDASGTAYGLTQGGGKYGTGTFYKLTPTKSGLWKETILYQFPNCANGCVPSFTLVSDKAGNLYSSGAGGPDCGGISCGTVFKFVPQKNGTWKYSVVHKFTGTDGAFPYGVVLDGKGNIFGTTMNGGKYNMGVAFEITP